MCANMKLPIVHKPCVHIDSWSTDNCLLRYIVTTAFWPIECTDMYLNDVPHVIVPQTHVIYLYSVGNMCHYLFCLFEDCFMRALYVC